ILNFDENIKLNFSFENDVIDFEFNFEFSNETKKVNTAQRSLIGAKIMDYEKRTLNLGAVNTEVVVLDYDGLYHRIAGELSPGNYEVIYPSNLDINLLNNIRYYDPIDIVEFEDGMLKATFNISDKNVYYLYLTTNEAPLIFNLMIN